jgi:hypothetical protein
LLSENSSGGEPCALYGQEHTVVLEKYVQMCSLLQALERFINMHQKIQMSLDDEKNLQFKY